MLDGARGLPAKAAVAANNAAFAPGNARAVVFKVGSASSVPCGTSAHDAAAAVGTTAVGRPAAIAAGITAGDGVGMDGSIDAD